MPVSMLMPVPHISHVRHSSTTVATVADSLPPGTTYRATILVCCVYYTDLVNPLTPPICVPLPFCFLVGRR